MAVECKDKDVQNLFLSLVKKVTGTLRGVHRSKGSCWDSKWVPRSNLRGFQGVPSTGPGIERVPLSLSPFIRHGISTQSLLKK